MRDLVNFNVDIIGQFGYLKGRYLMSDLVSVIVPVYNVEEYINQCVESLVKQSYQNIEIILIDDGSTDDSGILCENWSAKDNRIKVIHTANRGLSAARNVGIKKAGGYYLYFIDSDDWVEYDLIKTLYDNMCVCAADLSSCGMIKDYGDRRFELRKDKECVEVTQRQMFHEILCNEYVYGYVCNKLFKAKLVNGLWFDEKLFSQEDMDFTMRYLKRCKKCVYTESEYYHYRQRATSMTAEIGYSPRKLSITKVYRRAIPIYEEYCPMDTYIVERNYLKININIIGRMKASNYKNGEIEKELKNNIRHYYKKVLREKKNSIGVKGNIMISYYFPGTMLKLKQKMIARRRCL